MPSFGYTGSTQTYTVPAGVTSLRVDLRACAGGGGASSSGGGYGARVQGDLAVTPGDVLTLYVPGGTYPNNGYGLPNGTADSSGNGVKSGGGAAIVKGGVIVALAGGGGSGGFGMTWTGYPNGIGGRGGDGGQVGQAGASGTGSYNGGGGGGASQSSAGGPGSTQYGNAGSGIGPATTSTFSDGGQGGLGPDGTSTFGGGGAGGAGYYGGGGGGSGSADGVNGGGGGGGGGGSSYAGGLTNVTYTTGYNSSSSAGAIVINAPPGAPGTPSVSPSVVDATATVTFSAATDPDGDSLTYELEYAADGTTFSLVSSSFTSGGSVNTTAYAPTTTGKFRVRAKDPSASYGPYATSAAFTIAHTPYVPRIMR